MYAATANGTAVDRLRATPQMTARRPKVATNSLKNCAPPARAWRDAVKTASRNIPWATATPPKPPAIWARM